MKSGAFILFGLLFGVGSILTGLYLWPESGVPLIGKVLFFALGGLLLAVALVSWQDLTSNAETTWKTPTMAVKRRPVIRPLKSK